MISIGDIIDGRYRLDAKISQGGMGTIWRATQAPINREVALKLLRPELSTLPHIRRRFAREARAAARLEHPNIAEVYDFGADGAGQMFIAMELIDGDPVSRCVETGLSALNIVLLADLLLAGLAHAHARGVIHRDLKPSNVLLAGSALPETLGIPKLVDFGIARVSYETDSGPQTNPDEVIGTPRYMSPEQASGDAHLDARTDIYNVGLILYELITGAPPFGDDQGLAVMSRHVHDPIPPMRPRAGLTIADSLPRLVRRALSKLPRDRWATAAEFRQDLAPVIDHARRDPSAGSLPDDRGMPGDAKTLATARQTLRETGDLAQQAKTVVDRPKVVADDAPEPLDAAMGPGFGRAPLVGRVDERRQLMSIARGAADAGRGCQVLIRGEAGVGKTRLSTWLKEACHEYGLLRPHLGAFSRGASGGLDGLVDVLESLFGTHGAARPKVRDNVGWYLDKWGRPESSDVDTIVEFLRPGGAAAGGRWSAQLSSSALFAAVTRVLELASQYRPRLILLDDIHWAGTALAEFLDYLAVEMRHRDFATMVVSTIRTEDLAERPQLAAKLNALSRYVGESVARIDLGRLDRSVSYRLVEAILPCDAALTAILYERSGGNPLHLVLLLRYLREEDLLEFDGVKWRAADLQRVRAAVPPSLAELFDVRIDQIEARLATDGGLADVMVRAAVVGPRFSYAVLRRIVELEDDPGRLASFDGYFDRLLAEQLIVEVDGRRQDWYQFSHGLLRDFLLRSNSTGGHVSRQPTGPAGFKRLHRLAARAMIDVLGERGEHFAVEIGAHWRAGGRQNRALHWYGRGAQMLRAASMYRQAADAYAVCVELMDAQLGVDADRVASLPALDDDARFEAAGVSVDQYLETLVHQGELLEGFGDFSGAEIAFRRVVRMVGADVNGLSREVVGELATSWLGIGHVAWQRGDFDAAEWAFEKARELVDTHTGLEAVDEQAARGLARVLWHRGEYDRAQTIAQAALASATAGGRADAEATALWVLGEVDRMRGRAEPARARYGSSLELYRAIDAPTGIARNLLSLAQLARHHKKFKEAADLYKRALDGYETLGDRRGAGQCHNGLGDIARFEERHQQARAHYADALDIYEAIGATYDIAVVYTNLGLAAIAMADYPAAESYLSTAGDIVTGDHYPYVLAAVEFNLALVKSLRGDDDASDAILADVLDLAERFPIPDLDYARPLERLGQLRADAGDTGQAVQLWQRAAAIYAELELDADLRRVRGYLADEDVSGVAQSRAK